ALREEPIDDNAKVLRQCGPAPPRRKRRDACKQFGEADRGEIERFSRLIVQPVQDLGLRPGLQRLRDDTGIEKNQSNSAADVSAASRRTLRRTPPNFRPRAANSDPILSLSGGRTA